MNKKDTYEGWIEAFTIFARYGSEAKIGILHIESDEIWAGPEPEQVSPDDIKRLKELGWWPCRGDAFYRHV